MRVWIDTALVFGALSETWSAPLAIRVSPISAGARLGIARNAAL